VKILAALGSDATFDHVGVAVRSIREIAGVEAVVTEDPVQRVSVAFVDIAGLRMELIQPLGRPSPIDESLQSGRALVHLCFRVPDLKAALGRARQAGMHQIARPVAARAFDNRSIAWLFSRTIGLIELLEDPAVRTPAQPWPSR
jgi:methylmalonyl-CoA/ethylmalonyl-CoA epimerase